MIVNAPTITSCTIPSTPPASIRSAAPRRIASVASPIACVPAAQAVTVVLLYAWHWKRRLT